MFSKDEVGDFRTDDRVRVVRCGEISGRTGTILGLSTDNGIIQYYIVLFDEPYGRNKAATIPNVCLELIKK